MCKVQFWISPITLPPPELVYRMRGMGWAPRNLPLPLHSGHYVIKPTLDFAHFWLGGVATGFRILRINLTTYVFDLGRQKYNMFFFWQKVYIVQRRFDDVVS